MMPTRMPMSGPLDGPLLPKAAQEGPAPAHSLGADLDHLAPLQKVFVPHGGYCDVK